MNGLATFPVEQTLYHRSILGAGTRQELLEYCESQASAEGFAPVTREQLNMARMIASTNTTNIFNQE